MNLAILEGKFKQNEVVKTPAGKTNLQKCTDFIDTSAISFNARCSQASGFSFLLATDLTIC